MKRFWALLIAVLTLVCCMSCGDGKGEKKENVTYALRVDSAVKSYWLGDSFEEPSMVTLIEMKDGRPGQRILEKSEYEVDSSAYDSTKEGSYEIVVTYAEKNATVKYTVNVKKASALSMTIEGQRLRFYEGDDFETGKISVTVALEDGTVKTLETTQYEVDFSAYKKDEVGSYPIVVRSEDFDAEERYTVYVRDTDLPEYGTKISILGIGNSYSQDAMNHLYTILRGYGFETITLANLMKSNGSLEDHANGIKTGAAIYEFELNVAGAWKTDPENKSLEYGLSFTEWDAVILQQRSGLAGLPATYGEDFEYLSSYVANRTADKATRIYWQLPWTYETDSTHADFKNYGNNQISMYNAIVSTVQQQVATSVNIDGILPVGTAVQNIRSLLTTDKITRDGFHLNLFYGRYLAGAVWAAGIVGGDPSSLALSGNSAIDQYVPEIRLSVAAAMQNPFKITDLRA